MDKIALIALMGTILGACSMAVNDVPQTTPPGKLKFGMSLGNYLSYKSGKFVSTPLAGISGRYGLNYNTDIGFRVFEAGFGLEGKRAFTDRVAISLGTVLGKIGSGSVLYNVYGTFLYGLRSSGTIPYIYIKPLISGFIGSSDDTTETLPIPSGFAIQGGFGYHGDPEKLLQPSAEIGVYFPLSGNLVPIIIISLGLNLQIGN